MHSTDLSFFSLTDDAEMVQPQTMVGHKEIKHGRGFVTQVLVTWSGLPTSLKTWESEQELRCRFPSAPAWGQAGSQGKGPATTPSPRRRMQRWPTSRGKTEDYVIVNDIIVLSCAHPLPLDSPLLLNWIRPCKLETMI